MAKRIQRKTEQTAEEKARIAAVREQFQNEKPTLDDLVESGDYIPMTQGLYLELKLVAEALRQARELAKFSLSDVSKLTGIDRAAISRLESGKVANTTINTINRLARAYGKRFTFRLEDELPEKT